MRIAINGMFWSEPHVGSGQYLHNLVRYLAEQPGGHRYILIVPRYRLGTQRKPALPFFQTVSMPTPFDTRHEQLAKLWFEQIAFGQAARKLRAHVWHVPYFGPPRVAPAPLVVTVHDLIPLLLPEYRGGRAVQAYMRLAAAATRRADLILADSQHTRQDLLGRLGVPAARVLVTYLAAGDELHPRPEAQVRAVRERFGLDADYVYYIGGFDARKNVATAIRAFARARRQLNRRVVLALAGRVPAAPSELFPDIHSVILEEEAAADVALLGPVSAEEHAALLSGCAAFVYPSRYEGFGLPPLEAMQCGAPVLAAATTSVGEVVGDGGLLLDPDDVAAWSAALARVLSQPALRDDLRRRGLARAARFRWSETAAQTRAAYERLKRR
ncbi:glycosyltransferase family 4 protein [Kallotenue papyrolyticum]|uniref:glycosyltransferase family 4 protein n=1 Tax=Kallotenue papyrolyticum TaxID=1325125 RepID=UPI0004786286|nr:glycosyltransferase family 1 protein [Kallotenue papyrolyticum]